MRIAILWFTIGCAAVAQNNLIQNGSFETAPPIPAGQTQVTLSGTQLANWVIPFGNIDVNGPFWSPSDGTRSIDLNGIEVGAIEQTIASVPGSSYAVAFDLGATGQTADLQVTADAQASPVFQQTGGTFPQVTYSHDLTWTFVATGTSTAIRFTSLSTSSTANGPHLDNVRVFERPAAQFGVFGTGCSGSNGVPLLNSQTLPTLGQPLALNVSQLPLTYTLVFGILGFSNSAHSGQALPIDLSGIGMPGCSQLVSIDGVFPILSVGSQVNWPVAIPANPFFAGTQFYVQAFVPDPGVNALGASISNAGAARIGF